MQADEKFYAWLDGELDGAQAEEMAKRVAADPGLAKMAEEHRAMHLRVRAAFDRVTEDDVPATLLAPIARQRAEVIDFGSVGEWRRRWLGFEWQQFAAMAATLALGVMVGTLVRPGHGQPVETRNGQLYAAGYLRDALDSQLASAPVAGKIRIALTFRDRQGEICRTFSDWQSAGLACRSEGRWKLRGLVATQGQDGEFRMAAGMDPALAALVESAIQGEPFDSEKEMEAKAHGWR